MERYSAISKLGGVMGGEALVLSSYWGVPGVPRCPRNPDVPCLRLSKDGRGVDTTEEAAEDGESLWKTASPVWIGGDGSGVEFEFGALAFSGREVAFSGKEVALAWRTSLRLSEDECLAWTLVLW